MNITARVLRGMRQLVCGLVACLAAGCFSVEKPAGVTGDAKRGRLLLEQFDCGRCHIIPGVRRAHGLAGPTLESYSRRVYMAGELPNEPALLVRWIRHPQSLVPDTLMPDQCVPDSLAHDMGAYLMSLH